MLILSRAKGEALVIDHPTGPVRVVVVEMSGRNVRLGILADKSVPVHREEVWREMERSGKEVRPR